MHVGCAKHAASGASLIVNVGIVGVRNAEGSGATKLSDMNVISTKAGSIRIAEVKQGCPITLGRIKRSPGFNRDGRVVKVRADTIDSISEDAIRQQQVIRCRCGL